jgi:hypothetical protein
VDSAPSSAQLDVTLLCLFLSRPIYAHADECTSPSQAPRMRKGHSMLSRACRRMALTLPIIPSPRLFHSEKIAMHGLYVRWAENRSER